MPETEPWTVGRLLNWTTDYLADRGSDSARLDAEVLLAEARKCDRIELYTAFDELADERSRVTFRELVRRRAEGMPVAYLVGRREFYALSFQVTPDVLIPRPETEFLVVTLLDLVKQRAAAEGPVEKIEVADVGTGSGNLAVCAAKHVANSRVTAIDVSPGALAVARCNAAEHGVSERIEFLEGDLFDPVPAERRFDFILSNPPYVASAEMSTLARDVREHEPHVALEAGPRGTEIIERLLPQAAERLRPGGWLIVEISPMIDEAVRRLLDAQENLHPAAVTKDLAGLPRVVRAQRR